MAFVRAPLDTATWWSSLTQAPVQQVGEFAWLEFPGGTELGFHPADDELNPLNGNPVVHWAVPNLDAAARLFSPPAPCTLEVRSRSRRAGESANGKTPSASSSVSTDPENRR